MSFISPFVLGYAFFSLHRRGKKMPFNVKEILFAEIENIFTDWPGKIRFSWLWSAGVHVPNASATIPGLILVNAEWASRIVLNQNNPHMPSNASQMDRVMAYIAAVAEEPKRK